MKRFSVFLVIIMVVLFTTPNVFYSEKSRSSGQNGFDFEITDTPTIAAAEGFGLTRSTTAFITRTVSGQSLRILNSYSNVNNHAGVIDFTDFQVSGWDLYNVTMDIITISATAERKTTGITANSDIQIQNSTTGAVTDALYQEFYSMPHDGRLENYSFSYKALYYSTALGKAYLVVRSAYNDAQTNVTSWISPFVQIGSYTTITQDCTSDGAILDANMPYYVVIDGTKMIGVDIGSGVWLFNWIYWLAQDVTGTDTGYHYRNDDNWYQYVGLGRREAELKYTYTPWNRTANSALIYTNPAQIDIGANSSPVDGMKWIFTDDSSITGIDFSSNQSIEISYNMELSYRKQIQSSSNWNIAESGDTAEWNVTTEIEYPSISNGRYLNLSIPALWTVTGLYNGSMPSDNYGNYEKFEDIVRCSNLTNGTWILKSSSHNFLQSISTFDHFSHSEIIAKTSMMTIIDINSTISDFNLDPVSTGFTNLTIWHSNTEIWSPNNVSVVDGKTHYLWDISATSTINGVYTIEEHWSNGTEAGYRSKSLTLYYPTSLIATDLQIDAFTESTFPINVYLEDTFTPQGLDGTKANVWYSFDGGANTSLIDHNNGTWTASISTSEKSYGLHSVKVYAEGYAIENQSLTISVTLIHDTDLLVVQWSSTNSISYVQTTELLVEYRRVGGTPIADGLVNVTIDGRVLPLTWYGELNLYKITFNGTDTYSGFATYNLVIQAWKVGYKAQFDDTEQLTIREEYTDLSVNWSNGVNITYIEHSILTVSYRMSNNTAIYPATVIVTDGTTEWHLHWNATNGMYWIRFNGTDNNPGFGTHQITILASKFGYVSQEDTSYSLTLREEPTSLTLAWYYGNTITYTKYTVFIVNYTMSDGTPVIGATVNVSIGIGFWDLVYNPLTKTYFITLNGTDAQPGFGVHSVIVSAGKDGFEEKSDDGETFSVILEPTSLTINWSTGYNITYVEQTTLAVTYKMNDETPIIGAVVNVTINGQVWSLTWDGLSSYIKVFRGSDSPPGLGAHEVIIRAGKYGFVNRIDLTQDLILREEPTEIQSMWVGLSTITYVGSTILAVNFTMSNGAPIAGAVISVTIDSVALNLTWDESTETYRWKFSGHDDPPGLGSHILIINASKFGFITAHDSKTLVIVNEPTTLIIEWLPRNNITFTSNCILSIGYLMNSNNSAITDATVVITLAGSPRLPIWNQTAQRYYLFIDGDIDLPGIGTFSVTVEASRYGFDTASNVLQEIILRREPTVLSVSWANGINNPGFFDHTYIIVEYTYGGLIPVNDAVVNVTVGAITWTLVWNQTEGYYQLRFNGSDPVPGVGTHSLIVRAWKYGFIEQVNSEEEIILPVIPTLLDIAWTNGDTITYVEETTLQAFYRMFNGTWIVNAIVNVTIDGITLSLEWNPITHAYERTFIGSDDSLDFATYPVLIMSSLEDFQSQTNSAESLTKQLEPSKLVVSWIGGDNITYFSGTRLSVQFTMNNGSPISTGILNATLNGYVWNLVWNSTSFAYETLIFGSDSRLKYGTFDVAIYASCFGYIPSIDLTQKLTIRLEDTYITFEWIPSDTISYLDTTLFRIYYRYLNGSPVVNAIVNASYVLLWDAEYNSTSGAYEIAFTGSDIPSPVLGPHTFLVLASKPNHVAYSDTGQTLTIVQEETSIHVSWLNGDNTITYVESATIFINYSITESGLPVANALVTIRIGGHTWYAVFNETSGLYAYIFTGDMDPPGLGTFMLYISAMYVLHEGFESASDNSHSLRILSESVDIQCYWIGGDTITYVGSTILVVNYTMSNGSAISGASVNVTIGLNYWELSWDASSQTYRLMFSGSDLHPGLGYHELDIKAGRDGFDSLSSTLSLEIVKEPTKLIIRWSGPYENNITYFQYTYLFVEYLMNDNSPILGSSVNVTIELMTLMLNWNATEGAYGIRFNGSDVSPGFGTHSLMIVASKYGFMSAQDSTETLVMGKDRTTIQMSWSNTNSISYVEYTTLMVYYRMSNGSPVPSAIVDVSIGLNSWSLIWNASAQAYCFTFDGNMDPPSLGTFILFIEAAGDIYASQSISTILTIHEEPTSAIVSWSSMTLDWTQSIFLEVMYRDSYGRIIDGATQKIITINGVPYAFKEIGGIYRFEVNNTFDLGHHLVMVNISKYGYNFAVNSSISFDIIEAATNLVLLWNTIAIDYLGQIDLSANYSYAGNGGIVPQSGVIANITIDDSITLPLIQMGNYWVVSLTGIYLDLGPHSVVVMAKAYGYCFAEAMEILTVNEVQTDALSIIWIPSNLTIEYTDTLNIIVDYTYYGGDVPADAIVNVTIDGDVYNLLYTSGAWRVSISGNQIGIGIYDATVTAWLYGYTVQTQITTGLNITLAANSFIVTWQPSDLTAAYIDIINVSVIYTQDYDPILEASVYLSINGTLYELIYDSYNEAWKMSIRATAVGLGVWNVTVTANKTGFADGWYSSIFTILPAVTNLNVTILSSSFYYDEGTVIYIYYQMENSSFVPTATLVLTIQSVEYVTMWDTDHWTATFIGSELGIGIHNLSILVTAYGFVEKHEFVSINILPIPTIVEYTPTIVVFAHDDIIIELFYMDNRTSSGIPSAYYLVDWNGSTSVADLGNGTYLVEIDGTSLHVGYYIIEITLGLTGYSNRTIIAQIEILSIPTELHLVSYICQYTNETINIQARFMDLAHSNNIDWAVIIATLEGMQYLLLYNTFTQNYSVSIMLPNTLMPNTYSILISAHAVDCDSKEGLIELEILPKATYILTLEVVSEIENGEQLPISVFARHNGQPIANINLTLFIVLSSQSGPRTYSQVIETDSFGVAVYIYNVPSDATSLQISVRYSGSISVWPAESEAHTVEVRARELGLIEMILRDPVLLSITVASLSTLILALVVMKRRRNMTDKIIESTQISNAMISEETISITSPIDKMKEAINKSESGLTRSEISELLGISSSKVSAIAKDLLESDSEFYEVRIGTRRIIRKR